MKTGLSLTQLAIELERRAGQKKDFVANTNKLWMNGKNEIELDRTEMNGSSLPVNSIAHRQIAAKLDIPAKYYDRMLTDAQELLSFNVNHWLTNSGERRMVRTLDGKVRAFLSDKYQRIENEEIANVVLPILMEQQDLKIASCEITESRMYIKAIFPSIQGEVVKGDVVESGIFISNSEVGQGAVNIQPFIHRLVCLNGMVINDAAYRGRHVGARASVSDAVYELLSDETKAQDDKVILMKVKDVVKSAFNPEIFKGHLQQMREAATGERMSGNPAEAVKLLARKEGLSEFEQGSVLRNLIEGADLTRWGLLNAVTATAKEDALTYDRATELETLGGKILNFPRQEWSHLAQAA